MINAGAAVGDDGAAGREDLKAIAVTIYLGPQQFLDVPGKTEGVPCRPFG
jgi:hypothetical protein